MKRRLQGGAEGISAEAASAAAGPRLQKAVAVRRAVHAKEAARDLDVPHGADHLDCIAAVDAERRHEVVDAEDLRGSISVDRSQNRGRSATRWGDRGRSHLVRREGAELRGELHLRRHARLPRLHLLERGCVHLGPRRRACELEVARLLWVRARGWGSAMGRARARGEGEDEGEGEGIG